MQWYHDFMAWAKEMTNYFIALAEPYGAWAIFAWAFAESSFFPIPPDPLLIMLCVGQAALKNPALCFWYAAVASVASVLGGCFGYWIGLKGGRPLLKKWFKGPKTKLVEQYYQKYDVWAVGIAGFTPIPYKIFTISAGVFDLSFGRFIIASVISRSARFFLVATVLFFFGRDIWETIQKRFDLLTILFVILLIGGFFVIRTMGRRAARRDSGEDAAESGD